MLDPDPEPSSTLFGYVVASLGDVNGDSVLDYAVGAPFQDGDFVSTATGFGYPQNVGKVFIVDGASFAILSEMDDPEFEVIQDQHFGGQLGHSLSVSADINGDGIADLIAGVPHHISNPDDNDLKTINSGKALVFSGKTGALLFTLSDPAEQEEGRFGIAVAALGDVDSDGIADFVVGADGKDIGGGEDSPDEEEGTQRWTGFVSAANWGSGAHPQRPGGGLWRGRPLWFGSRQCWRSQPRWGHRYRGRRSR